MQVLSMNGTPASSVLPDISAPRLLTCVVDMSIGLLSMSFTEVVLTNLVRFDWFTCQMLRKFPHLHTPSLVGLYQLLKMRH